MGFLAVNVVVSIMDDDTNMDLTYTESMRLICAFKKHGILWNPHVRGYHNRETKEEAWKIIAAESSIHPEVCKRKMKSLVSSCRREKIKIIKSRSSGKPEDIYDPKWRYWNAFKFLRGLEDDDEDPLGTAPEQVMLIIAENLLFLPQVLF